MPARITKPELSRGAVHSLKLALLLAAAILVLSLILASRAEALVYWANNGNDTIGRANLDGTGVDPSFITGAAIPYGVAVNDEHVYWSSGAGWIGRANLDGSGVDPNFIPTAPGGGDAELAIDERHIFWSNPSPGWIGRANLDGTGVDQTFMAPQSDNVRGLALNDKFIFWADYQNSRIGSGEFSTLGVNPLFINPTADNPEGVAVDAAHIYWSNSSHDTIGRANINSTGVDQDFIPTSYAYGVEVNSKYIYWANYDTNSIGRANLNGTGPDPGFIAGAEGPEGVALDWILNPGAGFGIVKVKRNRKRGTAKVIVKVSGPGKLVLRGRGLRRVRKNPKQARVGLPVRPRGALMRRLAASGKARVKIRITFRPKLSSTSKTRARKLRLRKV
jgi:hypothetical protein